jgi:Zn-dependent oligopeptidase
MELMAAVWTPAVRCGGEVADMQRIATREGAKFRIAPWDYRYYAEKVRKAKYDFDEAQVKPYLQLEKLREGMFHVAGELFGMEFSPVEGVPVFHPDVRVWKVTDRNTGQEIGLWYFDPYARPGKRSGAWMNPYRAQELPRTGHHPGLQQLQLREAASRRSGAGELGGCPDALPRVRARGARAVLAGALPLAVRDGSGP